MDPSNGFRLIFPRGEGEDDPKYDKYLRKALEIWQVTTGTLKACDVKSSNNGGIPKKKKKPKKKQTTTLATAIGNAPPIDTSMADAGDEGEGQSSSRIVDISDIQQATPTNLEKRSSSNVNGTAGDTNFFEKRSTNGISKAQSNSAGSSANVKATAK